MQQYFFKAMTQRSTLSKALQKSEAQKSSTANQVKVSNQFVQFSLTESKYLSIQSSLPKGYCLINPYSGDLEKIRQDMKERADKLSTNATKADILDGKRTQKRHEERQAQKNINAVRKQKNQDNNSQIFQQVQRNQKSKKQEKQKKRNAIKNAQLKQQNAQILQIAEQTNEKLVKKNKLQKPQISRQKQVHSQNFAGNNQLTVSQVEELSSKNRNSIPALASGLPRYNPLPSDYQPSGTVQANNLRYVFGLSYRLPIQEPIKKLNSQQKNFCTHIIQKLKSHRSSVPFHVAVDIKAQDVPDYYDSVYNPMDLQTISKKVVRDKYKQIAEFHADINRIILNSYKYNLRQTSFFKSTVQFQDYYQQLLKKAESNPLEFAIQIAPKNTKKKTYEDSEQFQYGEKASIIRQKKRQKAQQRHRQNQNLSRSQNLQKEYIKNKNRNNFDDISAAFSNQMFIEQNNQVGMHEQIKHRAKPKIAHQKKRKDPKMIRAQSMRQPQQLDINSQNLQHPNSQPSYHMLNYNSAYYGNQTKQKKHKQHEKKARKPIKTPQIVAQIQKTTLEAKSNAAPSENKIQIAQGTFNRKAASLKHTGTASQQKQKEAAIQHQVDIEHKLQPEISAIGQSKSDGVEKQNQHKLQMNDDYNDEDQLNSNINIMNEPQEQMEQDGILEMDDHPNNNKNSQWEEELLQELYQDQKYLADNKIKPSDSSMQNKNMSISFAQKPNINQAAQQQKIISNQQFIPSQFKRQQMPMNITEEFKYIESNQGKLLEGAMRKKPINKQKNKEKQKQKKKDKDLNPRQNKKEITVFMNRPQTKQKSFQPKFTPIFGQQYPIQTQKQLFPSAHQQKQVSSITVNNINSQPPSNSLGSVSASFAHQYPQSYPYQNQNQNSGPHQTNMNVQNVSQVFPSPPIDIILEQPTDGATNVPPLKPKHLAQKSHVSHLSQNAQHSHHAPAKKPRRHYSDEDDEQFVINPQRNNKKKSGASNLNSKNKKKISKQSSFSGDSHQPFAPAKRRGRQSKKNEMSNIPNNPQTTGNLQLSMNPQQHQQLIQQNQLQQYSQMQQISNAPTLNANDSLGLATQQGMQQNNIMKMPEEHRYRFTSSYQYNQGNPRYPFQYGGSSIQSSINTSNQINLHSTIISRNPNIGTSINISESGVGSNQPMGGTLQAQPIRAASQSGNQYLAPNTGNSDMAVFQQQQFSSGQPNNEALDLGDFEAWI